MNMRARLMLLGLLVAVVMPVLPATAAEPDAGETIHPYPLYPFDPVPGRPGFGTPEIQPHYEAWREALAEGDEEKAAEILGDFQGEHFMHGYPQFLPYPGSIEHVRACWQRYVPPYPLYNHHTLVENFILHEYPQTRDNTRTFEETLYWIGQWNRRYPTSATRELEAFPWKPGESIEFSVGPLAPRRMYTVRVISALKPEDLIREQFPANVNVRDEHGAEKQLVFKFEINDRPDGSVSTYYLRGRTWDQFYDTVSCRFNAYEEREYNIRITLLEESEATLYTYNVDVHNVFGATAQRAGKERATTVDPEARAARWADRQAVLERMQEEGDRMLLNLHSYHNVINDDYPNRRNWSVDTLMNSIDGQHLSAERRATRDDDLWRSLPPINHMLDRYRRSHLYDNREEFEKAEKILRAGWAPTSTRRRWGEWYEPWQLLRRNDEGDIIDEYTWADMAENKELPGTEDRGYGVRLDESLGGREVMSYLAYAHAVRCIHQYRSLDQLMNMYDIAGDEHIARDAAFLLARMVYHMPALRGVNYITWAERLSPITRGEYRADRYGGAMGRISLTRLIDHYDQLFEFIEDNQELADALGRHIPWIETPADVRYLFEVYGLQYHANELTHYRYAQTAGPSDRLVRMALIQNDNEISRPWMEFIFKLSWQYPHAIAGVDDTVITSLTRDGVTKSGSWAYTGALGLSMAGMTEEYVNHGGDEAFDLSDFRRYPKSLAGAHWFLESRVGGGFYPGIGDVGGPARPRNYNWKPDQARESWAYVRDPQFAWFIANELDREFESEEEWRMIEEAAATVDLNPRLTQRSRVLSDWFGVLEGGSGHPDYRFHRAVALNVGDCGTGHSHYDTLDLRLWALGENMVGDLGQRQAYGRPRHNATHSHNLVEVDGDGSYWTRNPGRWDGHAWVRNLFDAPGAHYMSAEATPPANHPNVNYHRRHVALIDVHEGRPSPQQENPHEDDDVVLPASYVMDVVRVSGGNRHTYCFLGSIDDNHVEDGGFEVNVVNREIVTPGDDTPEGQYLRGYRWARFAEAHFGEPVKELDREWAADPADDTLVATWRRSQSRGVGPGGRKHVRLHLLNVGDHRILHGINTDQHGGNRLNPDVPHYGGRLLYAQKDSEAPLESVYVALIEPFEGASHIADRRLLEVLDNEDDALRAAAVEVKTTNGHTDLLFHDGRPATARQVESSFGGDSVRIQGEYAYLSYDDVGLRQATLTGGDHVVAPGIELRLSASEYRGTVSSVDYLDRIAVVDGLPAEPELARLFFEIGNDRHRTSFEVDELGLNEDGSTTIHLRKSIEMMLATVTDADYETGTVTVNVAMRQLPGRDQQLVATNDDFDNRRRANFIGGDRFDGFTFELQDRPINADEFPVGGKISIFAFGEGDEVSLKTGVSLRRGDDGVWQVHANAPFTVNLDGADLEWSADGKTWYDVEAGAELGPGRGQPRDFMLRIL